VTTDEWLIECNGAKDKLKSLIGTYHPVSLKSVNGMKITAPNAEQACEVVRNQIRKNFEGNPVTEFQAALDARDVSKLMKLLNDAWFGVPETIECWNIEGFTEAVNLMDDPPE
jgi:hypothetical protein